MLSREATNTNLKGIIVVMILLGFMVFKATFNNIKAISWWSVLLVEKTTVAGEKPLACRK
jgi:hypothetical protein